MHGPVAQRDGDLAGAGGAPALGDPRVLALGPVHGRPHGVEQVRSGVGVGDREDVEGVDLLAVGRQMFHTPTRTPQKPVGVQ